MLLSCKLIDDYWVLYVRVSDFVCVNGICSLNLTNVSNGLHNGHLNMFWLEWLKYRLKNLSIDRLNVFELAS